MNRNNVFGLQQLAGDERIVRVHGEVAADGQNSVVERVELGQQLHIAEESGVAGKVQLGAVEVEHYAAGMTAGNACAVEGEGETNLAERELEGAAEVHSVSLAASLLCQTADFSSRDDGCITILGDFKSAAEMVEMTVADEDVVDLDIFSGQTFRVAFKIGVEDDSRIIFFDDETCVVDEVEFGFCSHDFFLLRKSPRSYPFDDFLLILLYSKMQPADCEFLGKNFTFFL